MKQPNINQEILFFMDTSFAKREFCEKDNSAGKTSTAEQLEKACWSGLLFEMLPAVYESDKQDLFIWKVNQAEQFIRVVVGSAPASLEYETSIDPYFSLPIAMMYN